VCVASPSETARPAPNALAVPEFATEFALTTPLLIATAPVKLLLVLIDSVPVPQEIPIPEIY
jgi:hypothetical protein